MDDFNTYTERKLLINYEQYSPNPPLLAIGRFEGETLTVILRDTEGVGQFEDRLRDRGLNFEKQQNGSYVIENPIVDGVTKFDYENEGLFISSDEHRIMDIGSVGQDQTLQWQGRKLIVGEREIELDAILADALQEEQGVAVKINGVNVEIRDVDDRENNDIETINQAIGQAKQGKKILPISEEQLFPNSNAFIGTVWAENGEVTIAGNVHTKVDLPYDATIIKIGDREINVREGGVIEGALRDSLVVDEELYQAAKAVEKERKEKKEPDKQANNIEHIDKEELVAAASGLTTVTVAAESRDNVAVPAGLNVADNNPSQTQDTGPKAKF